MADERDDLSAKRDALFTERDAMEKELVTFRNKDGWHERQANARAAQLEADVADLRQVRRAGNMSGR